MLYLDRSETVLAMPPLDQQLLLAEAALKAVLAGGEVPGKVAVHPRSPSSIAYAMPARLEHGPADANPILGVKWVSAYPANSRSGTPAVAGLIALNDPTTLAPTAILDCSAITLARTAAVSGVALSRLMPDAGRRRRTVGILGAGAQSHGHVPVVGHLLPGADVLVYDRNPDRAQHLASVARLTSGIGSATNVGSAGEAVEASDIVISAVSFGPVRQAMPIEWLRMEALVITVDYDMYASAGVARESGMFLVDELGGFLNARADGHFAGFPDPTGTLGGFLLSRAPRPAGRVLVSHLGMSLTDLVFGDAIVTRAAALGLGTELPDTLSTEV